MLVRHNTERWEELFSHLDNTWKSTLPASQTYADGLTDPSIWPKNLSGSGMADVLHAQGVADIQRGSQHLIRALMTYPEGATPALSGNGVLSAYSKAITDALACARWARRKISDASCSRR